MPQSKVPTAGRWVFVYGTLRAGDDNDITRLQPAPTFIGKAQIAGTLYHLGRYPGVVLGGAGAVHGEVYQISAELERKLDEIESLYPQQKDEYFKRELVVNVQGQAVPCVVYEINPIYTVGKPVLAGGDWVRER
jgi:gamma-glutamylcyclotransferase (GGCT)/AIG2-like uncharacterized protein YtfP